MGHIFENSINDIENITSEAQGLEVKKSKTKRKKEGVFYTPKYITKNIVENTIGKLCEEKKGELGIIDEKYTKGRKSRRSKRRSKKGKRGRKRRTKTGRKRRRKTGRKRKYRMKAFGGGYTSGKGGKGGVATFGRKGISKKKDFQTKSRHLYARQQVRKHH